MDDSLSKSVRIEASIRPFESLLRSHFVSSFHTPSAGEKITKRGLYRGSNRTKGAAFEIKRACIGRRYQIESNLVSSSSSSRFL